MVSLSVLVLGTQTVKLYTKEFDNIRSIYGNFITKKPVLLVKTALKKIKLKGENVDDGHTWQNRNQKRNQNRTASAKTRYTGLKGKGISKMKNRCIKGYMHITTRRADTCRQKESPKITFKSSICIQNY